MNYVRNVLGGEAVHVPLDAAVFTCGNFVKEPADPVGALKHREHLLLPFGLVISQ